MLVCRSQQRSAAHCTAGVTYASCCCAAPAPRVPPQVRSALAERCSARLVLSGADGSGGLSGLSLAQGVVELEATPTHVGWRAELSVGM